MRFPLNVATYFAQRDQILAAHAAAHWGIWRCAVCDRWLPRTIPWCEGGCEPCP